MVGYSELWTVVLMDAYWAVAKAAQMAVQLDKPWAEWTAVTMAALSAYNLAGRMAVQWVEMLAEQLAAEMAGLLADATASA